MVKQNDWFFDKLGTVDSSFGAPTKRKMRRVIVPVSLFLAAWAVMVLNGIYHSMVPQFDTIGYWHAVLLCIIPWVIGYMGILAPRLPIPFTNKN